MPTQPSMMSLPEGSGWLRMEYLPIDGYSNLEIVGERLKIIWRTTNIILVLQSCLPPILPAHTGYPRC